MVKDPTYALGILEGFVSRVTIVPSNVWAAIHCIRDAININTCDDSPAEDDIIDEDENPEPDEEPEKKPKRKNNMSPENRRKCSVRLAKGRWKKENIKRAENGLEPLPEPDWDEKISPVLVEPVNEPMGEEAASEEGEESDAEDF